MLTREVPTRRFLPTLPRFEPVILDHSATKALKECPRKYFFRYVLGRVSRSERSKTVFGWGNAIHKFFENVYQTEDFDKAFTAALSAYRPPDPITDTKKAHEIYSLKRLMLVSRACWDFFTREKKLGNIEVLAIEQPFSIALSDGTQTGGRFDQVIKLGGRTWIRDWKSTSQQIQYFSMTLNPNDQATRYLYALSRLSGWDPKAPNNSLKAEGIQFVVIQNMETEKSIKLEAQIISKSSEELIDWEKDQILIYKTLDQYRQEDRWPKHENSCNWCDYRVVCAKGAESSMEYMLKNDFDLKPWDHEKVDQKVIKEEK